MRSATGRRRVTILVTVVLTGVWPRPSSAQMADLSFLTTRAEATEYRETTRYDEVMGFLEVLAAQDPLVHLTGFGYSVEGRVLPLVVYGDVVDPDAESVRRDGRVRVFVQANIHAGEVCGKEAMLAFLRDLVVTGRPLWADSLILIVAPIYNVDGNERVSLYNRPRQNGPVGGMGTRTNAQDLDLNRDHVKLASPEARSLIHLLDAYDPHIAVDLHTTNGTQHGYHVTYAVPMHPNTHPAVVELLRDRAIPSITDSVRARSGYEMYYYGNLPWPGQGGERGWYTYDHRPRFNTNYVGLRNRLGILSEGYAYASFRERVLATRTFVEEIIDWAYRNAGQVAATVKRADSDEISGTELAVRAEPVRSEEPVEIILGSTERERHPNTGGPIMVMTPERHTELMPEYGTFRASETVTVPKRYLVPPELTGLRSLLDDHGIGYEVLESEETLALERYRIDSTRVAERPFQGVNEREVFGAWVRAEVVLAPGTLSVPADQPLGRLAVTVLEPRSDDGALDWGLLDNYLKNASAHPVLREPVR